MVFCPGTWELDSDREAKRARAHDGGTVEKKAEAAVPRDKPVTEEQARHYQLEVLEQAKSRNTIAFLKTGAGKTLIAVLLIKSICDKMLKETKKILAVFLVPKVPLVYQQAEVIRDRTGYRVGHYCGEMGQDFWDSRKWQREFDSKQVGLLNVDGYYNALLSFIDKAVEEGFIKPTARHIIVLAPTPSELLDKLEEYSPRHEHEELVPKTKWETTEQLSSCKSFEITGLYESKTIIPGQRGNMLLP